MPSEWEASFNTGCKTAANIYLDAALTTPTFNPVTADGSGNYDYYIASGCVDEQISSPGQGSMFVPNVCPFNGTSGGGGGLNPGAQQQVVFYPTTGTTGGPTNITVDVATKNNLTIPNSISSAIDNQVFQANTPGVAGIQSTITAAGTTGSVVIPLSNPVLLPGPITSTSVIATGGVLGTGTYNYLICPVVGGVEQRCATTSATIASGTTNKVNFSFPLVYPSYNIYGRIAGSIGLLQHFVYAGAGPNDTGSTSPGAAYVGNFSNLNGIAIDDLRLGPLSHFASGLPVSAFGCAADGVTDDRACWQAAINYAEAHGFTQINATPGKT